MIDEAVDANLFDRQCKKETFAVKIKLIQSHDTVIIK